VIRVGHQQDERGRGLSSRLICLRNLGCVLDERIESYILDVPSLALQQRVKLAFDLLGLLNPGKVL
jgi:hypothetical protein